MASQEVHSAIELIDDSILRIISLSIILNMKNPSVFDKEQTCILKNEIINQLQTVLPCLSLLDATLLFVRCHSVRSTFSLSFQQMASVIAKKLNHSQNRDQAAAFIALQQLDNADLSKYLSKFANQVNTWSDYLHFNSTIFFDYFIETVSFNSSNTIILSCMYLAELAFDIQILKIYTADNQYNINPCDDSLTQDKVITVEIAKYITNDLQMLKKEHIYQTVEGVSSCLTIEEDAVSIIEKWLKYRMDKDLKFFSHYAALQLIMRGSDSSNLIDIIDQIFDSDSGFRLQSIIELIFNTKSVSIIALRHILLILNQKPYYPLRTSFEIRSEDVLQSILELELERITLNTYKSSEMPSNTFLTTIICLSEGLEVYLTKHLRIFLDEKNEIDDIIKEDYLLFVVKWIMNKSNWTSCMLNMSMEIYQCILAILDDKRFYQVQKIILSHLNLKFFQLIDDRKNCTICLNHFLMQNDTITHIEKVIQSFSINEESVLVLYLLTYGNFLLYLQKLGDNRNVTSKMQSVLTTLFETSPSEIISIRAAFCLMFAQQSNITSDNIWNWLESKWDLTFEKRYSILMQQTLYEGEHFPSDKSINKVIKLIQTHADKLINIFVQECYAYLCNNNKSKCFSDLAPNYIYIAVKFIETDRTILCDAIRKSVFGEKKFKTELYLCRINRRTLLQLYAAFDVFTIELADMLRWLELSWDLSTFECLKRIRDVSGRDVIEKLFELLHLSTHRIESNHFPFIMKLLIHLAQVNAISLLEVHQQVSMIISSLPYQDDDLDWKRKGYDFNRLLHLSCIRGIEPSLPKIPLFTKSDIDKDFKTKFKKLDQMSVLFVRRN